MHKKSITFKVCKPTGGTCTTSKKVANTTLANIKALHAKKKD
jgi:hypothetical protein